MDVLVGSLRPFVDDVVLGFGYPVYGLVELGGGVVGFVGDDPGALVVLGLAKVFGELEDGAGGALAEELVAGTDFVEEGFSAGGLGAGEEVEGGEGGEVGADEGEDEEVGGAIEEGLETGRVGEVVEEVVGGVAAGAVGGGGEADGYRCVCSHFLVTIWGSLLQHGLGLSFGRTS